MGFSPTHRGQHCFVSLYPRSHFDFGLYPQLLGNSSLAAPSKYTGTWKVWPTQHSGSCPAQGKQAEVRSHKGLSGLQVA